LPVLSLKIEDSVVCEYSQAFDFDFVRHNSILP
jgi:hypothetical protein